jgi:TetR/AcrR family transcriptional regulator
MVKRNDETPHAVRQEALKAARRLFAERGFEGTAIQDVASAVGVSKQAVLHHYSSKSELRDAVLAELVEHWGEVLPRLLVEASGGFDRFSTVFGELVRFFSDEPSWAKLVVRELLDRPEQARLRMKSNVRPWVDAVAEYVRAGQGVGILREDIDAEAWVVEMLQLALFAAATHPVLAGAVPRQGGEQRLGLEVNRIAYASLFNEPLDASKRNEPWATFSTTTRI